MQRNTVSTEEALKTVNQWIKKEREYLPEIHLITSLEEIDAYLAAVIQIQSDLKEAKKEALSLFSGKFNKGTVKLNEYSFYMDRECDPHPPVTYYTLLRTNPPLPLKQISLIVLELHAQKRYLEQNKQSSNDITLRILTHAMGKIAGKTSEQELKSDELMSEIADAEYGVAWQALELKHEMEQQNHALREELRKKQIQEAQQATLLQQMQSQISKLTEEMQQVKIEAANAKKQVEEQKAELILRNLNKENKKSLLSLSKFF